MYIYIYECIYIYICVMCFAVVSCADMRCVRCSAPGLCFAVPAAGRASATSKRAGGHGLGWGKGGDQMSSKMIKCHQMPREQAWPMSWAKANAESQ